MKKHFRFFGGFLDAQQNWLNQMAHKGFRLVGTGKMTYEFEPCAPDEYQYAVEFVAQKSYKRETEYRAFLEDLSYRVFYKNANLNFSIGKVKWRPYGRGMGQIATNPGSYNKELFLVEKKNDGRPFALHTTNADQAAYYKPLRNAWLTITAMLFAFAVWIYLDQGLVTAAMLLLILLGLLCAIPTIRYQKRISVFSAQSNIEE